MVPNTFCLQDAYHPFWEKKKNIKIEKLVKTTSNVGEKNKITI